jgi:trimeric autotransporter adhesin
VPPGGSCTFRIDVTGTTAGAKTNVTSTVSSIEAGFGAEAGAGITVGDVFRLHYVSNLNVGDAFINITNSGNQNAAEDGSVPQNICVNVYAFAPSEELIACCACPVTPNALVSLTARSDLISNTLTPVVPNSITIALVASGAANSSCNAANLAAPTGTTTGNLATGLHAWSITLHSGPPASGLRMSETPFGLARLSAGQLSHFAWLCGFIQGNGSGYGICKSCRSGGLGAATH